MLNNYQKGIEFTDPLSVCYQHEENQIEYIT